MLPPYKPDAGELRASYRRADGLRGAFADKATALRIEPHWIEDGRYFWYTKSKGQGDMTYEMVTVRSGDSHAAFDPSKLAQALGQQVGHAVDDKRLGLSMVQFEKPELMRFNYGGGGFLAHLDTYQLEKVDAIPVPKPHAPEPWVQDLYPPETVSVASPDGQWSARISGHQILVKGRQGEEFGVGSTPDGPAYPYHLEWRPDSKKLIVFRVTPGDRKPVYLIQSTPPGGGRAVLKSRVYDLPGDKTDAFDLWVADPIAKTVVQIDSSPVDYGGPPELRWTKDPARFTYEKMDRGFQRWRVICVNTDTASSAALVDDSSKTFVDSTTTWTHYCDSGEILWRSERDGWGHLYLSDAAGKIENQVTHGEWVVRAVTSVDEKKRQIVFEASGMNSGEDPYFIHYYRINFDGSGLMSLTTKPGNHSAQFSPDGSVFIDTYSSPTELPVHDLRKASDGALISTLEKADVGPLMQAGWRAPQVFVAKGRDGKTDIWGLAYRPLHMDPLKRYPIVEDIYAGPQDSFVPKSFAPYSYDQSVAELGFVVVKIDGTGTRNRSKAFHDVAWKNIADAGFPDRILWMKALAKRYPNIDIDRVGVFGTSAGGQNSTGAVLFHPEFYKVAVSSCGCHDNRMDKLWWNEQWMGYPVGPEYAEQSNITNAGKLKGKLLLMVGELDTNVPPESTIRLCDAFMKAGKEIDFLIIPGSDHTSGGPYGERKRRDFLTKNLLGVEPPNWNAEVNPPGATR